MSLSLMHKEYLLQMVQTMYRYETRLTHMQRLLDDSEMMCFYNAYIGGGEL
jgi:hypothetical protein